MYLHPRAMATPPAGLGLLVQLVEEDRDQLAVHRAALERAGAIVHASTTAIDALAVAPNVDVDVLVCDTRLASIDGFTLLRLIRRMRPDHAALPAIALSPTVDEEEISEALRAGFMIHAVKPIAPSDLVQMVTGLGAERAYTSRLHARA